MRLDKVIPLALSLAAAVCLFLPTPGAAQVDYEVQVYKWDRIKFQWVKYTGHPVYFNINNLTVVGRPVAPMGTFQARVPERAGGNWFAWAGPNRYQYVYFSSNATPGLNWNYGGITVPSNRRTGIIYIADML